MFKMLLLDQGDGVIRAVDKELLFDAVIQWIIVGILILITVVVVLIIKKILK